MCLDLFQFNNSDGANVAVYGCNNYDNQVWNLGNDSHTPFSVVSQFNGKCIDVDLASSNVQTWSCANSANQQWLYDSQTGEIKSQANGYCLDASSDTNVYMHGCHGDDNQKWDLLPSGAIKNRYYQTCLDIFGFNDSNGANIAVYQCNERSNQLWHW